MRTMMVLMAMCAGCVTSGERATIQEVTGVTVTVRDAGQLAVSWTADPVAARYLVYQSAGGALPALVATVLDSSGGAPSTSWIATGLTAGVEYCYSIRSGFADGGIGAPGVGACGTATSDAVLPPGTKTITVSPVGFASSTWSFQVGPTGMVSNTNGILVGSIPMNGGDTVRAVDFRLRGSGQLVAAVKRTAASMAEQVLGSAVVTATSTWSPVRVAFPDAPMQPNDSLTLIFTAGAAGQSLGNVSAIYVPGP